MSASKALDFNCSCTCAVRVAAYCSWADKYHSRRESRKGNLISTAAVDRRLQGQAPSENIRSPPKNKKQRTDSNRMSRNRNKNTNKNNNYYYMPLVVLLLLKSLLLH